jgi:hypothetical protein
LPDTPWGTLSGVEGLHSINGLLVIAINGFAFVVGLVYLWRRREPPRLYAHLVALGQTLLVAQVALGLLLLSDDMRAPDRLHYLYGALALGAILSPWIYAPRERRRRLIWFASASGLATALAVRAYVSGT